MNEDVELIIIDDEDFDDVRNARVVNRASGGSRGRSNRRLSGRSATGVRRSDYNRGGPFSTGELVRRDTGSLSTGKLIEAGAQILAAIQPLPTAPVATGKLDTDLANMVLYQKALAEHAKRDEQLRTVGSLATKLFA